MSHSSPRSTAKTDHSITGFSTGSGLAIVIAALLTGGLLSLYNESIGWPYLTLFAVASIVVATFVNPRGLYITVASLPILYTFFTLLTGVLIAYMQLPPGQSSLGRGSLLIILYPLAQYFPALLMVTLGALIIALLRHRLLSKANEEIRLREERQRRRASESNRRVSREATRSRQRTSTSTSSTSKTSTTNANNPASTTSSRATYGTSSRLDSRGTERTERTERTSHRSTSRSTERTGASTTRGTSGKRSTRSSARTGRSSKSTRGDAKTQRVTVDELKKRSSSSSATRRLSDDLYER